MCEPYHSIVQFDVSDGQENMVRTMMEAKNTSQIILPERGVKIGPFINYATAGGGHSQALLKMGLSNYHRRLMDNKTDYETAWWNRTVKVDGIYRCDKTLITDAREAAEHYAKLKVIGDLKAFRSWFERAVIQTDRLSSYTTHFMHMLNSIGRESLYEKVRYFTGGRKGTVYESIQHMTREQIASLLLGFTRKRKMLVPEWADDDLIW